MAHPADPGIAIRSRCKMHVRGNSFAAGCLHIEQRMLADLCTHVLKWQLEKSLCMGKTCERARALPQYECVVWT